jgi:hypothetical protein
MEELIKHNEYVQSLGLSEIDAWSMMLDDVRESLKVAYESGTEQEVNKLNNDIDFIQKQLVRLSQR